MRMKAQRKLERDRARREEARNRTRAATDREPDTDDDLGGTTDLQMARSRLGYDE